MLFRNMVLMKEAHQELKACSYAKDTFFFLILIIGIFFFLNFWNLMDCIKMKVKLILTYDL